MTIQLSITSFVIVVLAVWRITHLFWGEDGPGDIFVRVRRLAGAGFLGRLLDCFYCLSLWVALPCAGLLGRTWLERLALWFSLSGGAILLERATSRPRIAPPPPAIWHEAPLPEERKDEESDHVMLR
ncbi:MAG: DUF1360 domain-containing protein [Acidobacteria bacterium]|nr:DUF1360 domain-containing protein [Acidobacteriota bacterium]